MIYASILDKKESLPFWKEVAEDHFTFTLSETVEALPECDILLISSSAGDLSQLRDELVDHPCFGNVPAAALTEYVGCYEQEMLCAMGYDDVFFMPLCKTLLRRRILSLTEFDGTGALSFESLSEMKADSKNGAYTVQSHDFTNIYRFILRLLERLGKSAQMLHLTLCCDDECSEEAQQNVMKILAGAVQGCLRRGDISSVFSKDQVIVLLMGADDDGGHLAANRIVSSFYSECDDDSFELNYNIREIVPKGQE